MSMINTFILAFIPVFVAVDAIGLVPLFINLTREYTPSEKQRIILQSMSTALILAVGFIFLGKIVFRALGITIGDFMIAGGSILFCIAIIDIIRTEPKKRTPINHELGAVPLGTPLIVGPAVLTTSLIIIDLYGLAPTLVSVFANVILAGFILKFSDVITRAVGILGLRALSKVISLFLAAIAIMMVRKGIMLVIGV